MLRLNKVFTMVLYMFMRKTFFPIFWVLSLISCGGGTGGTGPAPVSDSTILTSSAQNQASLVEGSDTINMPKTWNQWVTSGYKKNGTLHIYWYKDWGTVSLKSELLSTDTVNAQTTLLINHPQHGARNGDSVTLSNVSSTPHGLAKSWIQSTHTITYKDDNAYLITIPTLVAGTDQASFTAELVFKYLECVGTQLLEQGPARTEEPALMFRGIKASRAMSITTTKLQSCSPTESSYTTYKYFSDTNSTLKGLLGQDVTDGIFSVVSSFNLPPDNVKSGDKGVIGSLTNYSDRTLQKIDGTTRLSYEILRQTAQSVLLVLKSEALESNGFTRLVTNDLYGKSLSATGSDYNLLRSTISYNNARKTEVVIDYIANLTQIEPSYQSGSGSLQGGTPGTQQWRFFPIDVSAFKFGGTLEIEISLGSGQSAASYDLFVTSSPPVTAEGRPIGSLVNAYDVAPGSKTTLKYNFSNNKIKYYFLGVQGNLGSPSSATNTYSFESWVKE